MNAVVNSSAAPRIAPSQTVSFRFPRFTINPLRVRLYCTPLILFLARLSSAIIDGCARFDFSVPSCRIRAAGATNRPDAPNGDAAGLDESCPLPGPTRTRARPERAPPHAGPAAGAAAELTTASYRRANGLAIFDVPKHDQILLRIDQLFQALEFLFPCTLVPIADTDLARIPRSALLCDLFEMVPENVRTLLVDVEQQPARVVPLP